MGYRKKLEKKLKNNPVTIYNRAQVLYINSHLTSGGTLETVDKSALAKLGAEYTDNRWDNLDREVNQYFAKLSKLARVS